MINGLSGRPGSGKSYEAVVRHILPALQSGRKLVTNIPLNVEWFCNVVGPECRDLIVQIEGGFHNYGGKRYFSDAEHFLRYADWRNEKNQGVFFVVDECHLCMPKGSKDGGGTQTELKEYLSMHRHYGHDILLLSQNFRKIDIDVKDMIQNCYYATKKSFLGQDDKYILKVADGVSRNIVATYEREYEPKYFPAYQSHTKSEGSVQEAETVDVKVWWKNKYIYGSIACFVALPIILSYTYKLDKEKTQRLEEIKARRAAETKAPAKPSHASAPVQTNSSVQTNSPGQTNLPGQTNSARQTPPEKSLDDETKPQKKHPLDGLYLSITGTSADYTRKGYYQKLMYIAVSRNGQMLKEITSADLALAGYQMTMLNDCMVEIKYSDAYQDWLFCDTPLQVGSYATSSQPEPQKAEGG